MNAKHPDILNKPTPLAVNIDPVTKHRVEFFQLEDFAKSCIDERNLKVKAESYIYSKLPNYNCENCEAYTLINPIQLSEVIGYAIRGTARKYDTTTTPFKEIDSQQVSFLIGEKGLFASGLNKPHLSYVVGTNDMDLFIQLAKAGKAVLLHQSLDEAYKILNSGMPENVFRLIAGKSAPKDNSDLFVQVDDSFRAFTSQQIETFFLEKRKQIIESGAFNQDADSQHWGELLPLQQEESAVNNPYPIDALPLLAKEAVLAISEHVQSPIAMTAQCVIGAMSHIAQAKVNAPDRFKAHGEPCSLFLLTEGQSGSRKSTSKNLADRAILDFEKKQYEIYRADLEQWKSGQAGLPKKDREAYCAENPPANDPSTIYSDFTLESITVY